MVVTIVGLIGLFGVFTVTTRGNTEARESAEALAMLQGAADELKSMTVAEIETRYGQPLDIVNPMFGPLPFHEPTDGTGIAIGVTGVSYERRVTARRIDDDLVWVRVSVHWGVEGAQLGVTFANDRELGLEMVRSRTEGPL